MIIPWLIVPSQVDSVTDYTFTMAHYVLSCPGYPRMLLLISVSQLMHIVQGDARARWSLHLRRVGNIHTTPLPDQHIYQSQTSDPRKSTLGPTNRSRFRHIVVQDVQAQHFRFFCLGHLTTRQAQNVWYLGYEKIPLFIRSAQGRGSYASSPICGMRVNT